MVLGPLLVIYDKAGFFLKKTMLKMVKKGQKTSFFGLLKKVQSLVLFGIGVRRRFLWFFNILQKLHA